MEIIKEEWLPIAGFEEHYEISNLGRVRSLDCIVNGRNQWGAEFKWVKKGSIVKPHKHHNTRYYFVGLKKNGKTHPKDIHRLVAETFVPNPDNKPCVGHKDCNEANNCVENIYWCTYEENNNHPITKQRMSEGQKRFFSNGGNPSFKGRHHTEETKRKLSENHKGRMSGTKNPMYGKRVEKTLKQVNQYSINGDLLRTFDCVKDAAVEVGCNPTNISACCRGKCKTIKGYIWRYTSI